MITIKEFVYKYVENLKEGQTFQAREVARAYCRLSLTKTGEVRLPYSDTIQRYLRERREEKGDVNYYDYSKSIWWKNNHVATEAERCRKA